MAHFQSIFPILVAKIFFPENPALSGTTSYRFLAPCQNLEKTNDAISRKRPDQQKDGRKDGQTLFWRTLPTTAGGQITTLKEESFAELLSFALFTKKHTISS